MCGITGFWQAGGGDPDRLTRDARRMAATLAHRGPDDDGVWIDGAAGLGLGFRRLAILDLSPSGHQPMLSHDGRFVIVFNGEIYNYGDLRDELAAAGVTFRGTSDTEVILECVVRWGIEATLPRLWGMFALALWDRETRDLVIARDRLGKKPVYYGRPGGVFLFGSELKAIRAHASWTPRVDRRAVAAYLRYGYVPATLSIYEGVAKLPPGSFVRVKDAQPGPVVRYWKAEDAARQGLESRLHLSDAEAASQLERLLTDAIGRRMIADVPLGAFLSGGVDSSVVVAMMQRQSSRPVKTFTLGFREAAYDEAPAAARVAKHLGTEHTECYVTPAEARAVIPRLPALYDEPFADSSQIPTFLVSQLARRHVTVALSGDGGDELFGGYVRHQWGGRVLGLARWLPAGARRGAARELGRVPPHVWDRVAATVSPLLPGKLRQQHPGEKVQKLLNVLAAESAGDVYRGLVSQWQTVPAVAASAAGAPTSGGAAAGQARYDAAGAESWAYEAAARTQAGEVAEQFMLLDLLSYLPDDILTKVDRASMGISLEARAPLLDHRVVEWAWRLPLDFKLRNGQGKWLLRQVLYRHVPAELIERPKMGFGLPIGEWLRGPLREWAEDLLDESTIARQGFLDPAPIRQAWQTHVSRAKNLDRELWVILMFQAWLAQAFDGQAELSADVA